MVAPEAPARAALPPEMPLLVLKARRDFLAAGRGRKVVMPGFVLQANHRGEAEVRVGYVCSKKVGKAVVRNRAKRRLREIARLTLPRHGRPGWDYVLIGRKDATAELPFDALLSDLPRALGRVHP